MIGSHNRAVIVFAAAFAVFLICTDLLLFAKEKRKLYAEFEEQARNELSLIGTFVTKPLLEQQFAVVEEFILQWGKEKSDIIELKALSPKGFLLARFERPGSEKNITTLSKSVNFRDQHLLDLKMTKGLSKIDHHIQVYLRDLIIQSLIIIGVFGIILWFILKKWALHPLEKEIARRKEAEQILKETNDQLEVKVAERTSELASEKERLAVTLRSIGDGVITTNIEGEIALINKVAEDLTGWKQEEAVGQLLKKVFNIINEKDRKPCEDPVTKVLRTGQIIGLANHTALISRDGSEKSIADSAAPIRDKDSRIIGVVLVFRDITEKLRMEKEWIKVKKLESIGVLAGGIAHDFNNILSAILGNINLALDDAELKDSTRQYLAETEKASLRARNLTRQLLTFARGGEPVKETSSLANVIKDSANFVLHGDKVSCRFDIPEDLWLVDIDQGQISQVIQNIVLNSSQAMPEGGIITISCANLTSAGERIPLLPEGKFVKIDIRDNGIGISADEVDNIFDPYFSTKQEGSGLGLAITHSIINKHGGHIEVDSNPGVGTRFTIYLPASEKSEEQAASSPLSKNEKSSQTQILVMDDEEVVRSVAEAMLRRLGHEVVLAVNGEEAVRLYRQALDNDSKFDLVIMDLTVPGGMGGKDATREILKLDPDARVIVSSGYSNDPIMANFREHGFCSAIIKPYQLQELSRLIDSLT